MRKSNVNEFQRISCFVSSTFRTFVGIRINLHQKFDENSTKGQNFEAAKNSRQRNFAEFRNTCSLRSYVAIFSLAFLVVEKCR